MPFIYLEGSFRYITKFFLFHTPLKLLMAEEYLKFGSEPIFLFLIFANVGAVELGELFEKL